MRRDPIGQRFKAFPPNKVVDGSPYQKRLAWGRTCTAKQAAFGMEPLRGYGLLLENSNCGNRRQYKEKEKKDVHCEI